MKRLLLFACALSLFAQTATGQFYVRAHGTLNLAANPGAVIASPYDAYNTFFVGVPGFLPQANVVETSTSLTVESLSESMGEGVYAGIAAGYMFNEYIGAELGFGYLFGSEITSTYNDFGDVFDNKTTFNTLGITPTLVVRAPVADQFSVVARGGLFIGVGETLEQTVDYTGGGPTVTDAIYETETEGTLNIGFQFGVGAEYSISDKVGIAFDITYTGLTYEPESATVVAATENGVDVLNALPADLRNFRYVDTFDFDNISTATETNIAKNTFSVSSLGIGLGIKYTFGN